MDTIFNLTALKARMEEPPKGQRINNTIDGALGQLSLEQIRNLREIEQSHSKEFNSLLDDCEKYMIQHTEVEHD